MHPMHRPSRAVGLACGTTLVRASPFIQEEQHLGIELLARSQACNNGHSISLR